MNKEINTIKAIQFSRYPGMTGWPNDTLVIFKSGDVFYCRKRLGEDQERFVSSLEGSDWQRLCDVLHRNSYLDLKDNYCEMATDLCSENLHIVHDSGQKDIYFYGLEKPAPLEAIHEYLESLLEALVLRKDEQQWQRIEELDQLFTFDE